MNKIDVKILYLSCHNSLKKVYGVGAVIRRVDLFSKLGRQYLVSKPLREAALTEFEKMGLLKRENSDKVRILDFDVDIEQEPHKVLEKFNLCNY